MTSRRATLLTAAAGVGCLVLAVLVLLLARDAWQVERRAPRGDDRARLSAARRGRVDSGHRLPFAVTRGLLGVGDDLEFRRAIALGRAVRERPVSDDDVRQPYLPAKAALLEPRAARTRSGGGGGAPARRPVLDRSGRAGEVGGREGDTRSS